MVSGPSKWKRSITAKALYKPSPSKTRRSKGESLNTGTGFGERMLPVSLSKLSSPHIPNMVFGDV